MTKKPMHAIIIGATGLVGTQLLKQLQNDTSCERITAVVRAPSQQLTAADKVRFMVLADFLQLRPEHVQGHTHAFSCLGTTIKKAGSKDAFRKTDYALNAHFAQLFAQQEVHYLLLSAIGADAQSKFFYNRVKGELEDYVQDLALQKISVIRPSLLLGERNEQRRLEDMAQKLYSSFSHFIPDRFKYKPVTAEQVAHTMVEAAHSQTVKFEIYDNLHIQKM